MRKINLLVVIQDQIQISKSLMKHKADEITTIADNYKVTIIMATLFVKNVILFDDQISMLVFNPG
jgi:hypothetical protein